MAVSMQQSSPVAHWPVVLGVICKRNVASLIDTLCPPHPAPVLSCGHGVEALLLAILAGHHALYKVGHAWRTVAWDPCSSPAARAPLAMLTGWGRSWRRCLPPSQPCVWRYVVVKEKRTQN